MRRMPVMSNQGCGCRRRDDELRRRDDELRRRELLDRLLLLRLLGVRRLLEDLRTVLRLVIAQMFSYSLCIIP